MSRYKNLIFDLDGTLLDTLFDIVRAINASLLKIGITKQYTVKEGKAMIGRGSKRMVEASLQFFNTITKEQKETFSKYFLKHYEEFQFDNTVPYEGVLECLKLFKNKGYRLFIVSNKPDLFAQEIIKDKLDASLFEFKTGKRDDFEEKPNPSIYRYLKEKFSLKDEETLYIGDSDVDIAFAKNSNIDIAILTYGYGDYEAIEMKGVKKFKNFIDLTNFILVN